jgi:hypothetical protein
MSFKMKLIGVAAGIALILGAYVYFKYFFTHEQRNIFQKKLENITGQNLTVTVFGLDGKILKRWTNVAKITSGKEDKAFTYTYFYTKDNKYVQIPNSVWYVAEEE